MMIDSQKHKPYFFARFINGKVETQGDFQCQLGHKIEGEGKDTPDGIFAQWHWDGNTLTVTNDKYGFYPIYYYKDENSFVISPSIIRMIPFCKNRDLDPDALAVFLRTGSFIDNDTHFKMIKAVGPNSTLKWSLGKLCSTGGDYTFPKPIKISRQDAKLEYKRLFAKSITKRRPQTDRFSVTLSGGRDSRRILFELLKQGMRPNCCVTFEDFPDWRGEDLPIAKAIIKETGLKHVILKQPRSRFKTEIKKNLITGLCSSRSVKMLAMTDYLNEHAQTVYDGIGGMLVQSFFMCQPDINLYCNGEFDTLTRLFLMKWGSGEEAYDLVLNKKTSEMIHYDVAYAHLKKEVIRHKQAANPIGSYYFWNRTRRDISLNPYAMLSDVPYVYSPYIDHELCEFLLSLPVEIIAGGTLHDETLQEDYPQYAHIPLEDKSVANPQADAHWAEFIREFNIYYFKKMCFRSKLLNNRFLPLRMLRCSFDSRYRKNARWIPFVRLLWLTQLEELVSSHSSIS